MPSRLDPEGAGDELPKLRKMELSAEQMRLPGHLPTSCIVTPKTEFADKFLIEMSRGCPEKCKYCWATFGMGKFRWHPTEYILESLERARPVTREVGFLATAVGDHPEIAKVLNESLRLGFRSSVSSIRIPAVKEETLLPLYQSGARSITLAPETGSDRLRFVMNKPIPNSVLLEKVGLIFRHGFTSLKLYFILGLPTETQEDVQAILDLAGACRQLMLAEAPRTGRMGEIHLGCNLLIPKPYTPWQREALAGRKVARGEDLAPEARGGADAQRVDEHDVAPPGDLADLHQPGRQRRGRGDRAGRPRPARGLGAARVRAPHPARGLRSRSRRTCAGTSCAWAPEVRRVRARPPAPSPFRKQGVQPPSGSPLRDGEGKSSPHA